MTLVDDLRQSVMACDEAAVVELCRAHGVAALRAIRTDIETIVEEAERYDRDTPGAVWRARRSAAAIPACLSARTVVQAAGALDSPGRVPDPDRLADLLVETKPKWLPKLAQRLLGNRRGQGWPLSYRLVARGACTRPDDPRYVDHMISSVPVLANLRDDPSLRKEVWGFFESDARGLLLHRGWTEALTQLADDGLLDREQLIDAALDALSMQAPWTRLTWFASFVNALDPNGELVGRRVDAYVALMRSTVPQVVAIAQRALGPQLASGELRPEPFLDVAGSPLLLKDKGVAIAQLALLKRLAADPVWASPVLDVVSQGFAHRHRDVQERALRIVREHLANVDSDTKRSVEERYELLPPALRPVDVVTHSAPEPVTIRPLAADDEPLSDDRFVEALASLMERQTAPLDRVIEATYRVCGYPPEHRRELMRPLLTRTEPPFVWDALHGFAIECVKAIAGEPTADTVRPFLVQGLLDEVVTTARSGRSRPYLAMPTSPSGAIDPGTLIRRFDTVSDAGPAEIFAARLRADADRTLIGLSELSVGTIKGWPSGRTIVPTVRFDWRGTALHCSPPSHFESVWTSTSTRVDPATGESVTATREDVWVAPHRPVIHGDAASIDVFHYLWVGFDSGRLTPWWLSLFPAYVDLGAIMSFSSFNQVMDAEPSVARPNLLTPLLDRYVAQPLPTFGDADAIALACGLGAKPLSCRIAAIEALVAVGDDHDRVAHVGHWAGRLVVAQALKLGRIADALDELMRRSPLLARIIVVRLLERVTDHRDAHRVLALTADAFTVCGPVPLPDAVHQLAESAGKNKSAIAARRLIALATES